VRSVEVRDEIIQRVATEIVRRELKLYAQPSMLRECSGQNLDPTTIDPFSITADELRTRSEHLKRCAACQGNGACPCSACAGSGRANCDKCKGAGEIRKHFAKGGQPIACQSCYASGSVACAACGGGGAVGCGNCMGDGYHVLWLAYEERSRWIVDTVPPSPASIAYPQLAAERFLTAKDLTPFTLIRRQEAGTHHTLEPDDADGRRMAIGARTEIEPPAERVERQQYLRLFVARRDITYKMCATTGSVALCGHDLIGVSTPAALRPMRVRNALWVAFGIIVAVLGRYGVVALHGKAAYFGDMNVRLNLLWLFGTLSALPVIGGLLRVLRSGMGEHGLRRAEVVLEYCVLLSFIAMLALKVVTRPTAPEAQAALEAGAVSQARLIVDALKELLGPVPEVRGVEDDVMLAEAGDLPFNERLRVLDAVAAHGGRQAPEAAASARSYRLHEIQRLVTAGLPTKAVAAVDEWFHDVWRDDPEIAEARAAAHDLEVSMCADELCRFMAAQHANAARSCPERSAHLTIERERLLNVLGTNRVAGDDTPSKISSLQRLLAMASKADELLGDDAEFREQAKRAVTWASAERAKLGTGPRDPVTEKSGSSAVVTAEGARHP
jgi:hypothetical protein